MSSNFSPGDPGHVGEHNRVYDEIDALEDSLGALEDDLADAISTHESAANPHSQYVASSDSSVSNIVKVTQSEYDGLTPDSTTLYVITD